jgi:malonate decarboxylase beta subunit
MSASSDGRRFLSRQSFIELRARERARALLDDGSFRELLGPFERLKSPWLPLQDIVAQADDGVVLARGTLDGRPAVVAAIEGAYQGGSMGEVSGAKIAGALELALLDRAGQARVAGVIARNRRGAAAGSESRSRRHR